MPPYLYGIIGNRLFKRAYQSAYGDLPPSKKIEYQMRFGEKPIPVSIKTKPLTEPGPSFGGFLSFFFREDYIDYFKTQLLGTQPFTIDPKKGKLDWKWETPFESPATKKARIAAEIRGREAWVKGDWPYLSLRVFKSPLVLSLIHI